MHKIIRIALFIIICIILLNSLVFIGVGVYRSIHAYILIAQGRIEERPGVYIGEALDAFLMAIFFLVFSIGMARLFLHNMTFIKGYDLPWLKVENFSGLKLILWEMLLTTLFVFYITSLIIKQDHLEWTMLIIPGSILMLAFAYKLLKQGH